VVNLAFLETFTILPQYPTAPRCQCPPGYEEMKQGNQTSFLMGNLKVSPIFLFSIVCYIKYR